MFTINIVVSFLLIELVFNGYEIYMVYTSIPYLVAVIIGNTLGVIKINQSFDRS